MYRDKGAGRGHTLQPYIPTTAAAVAAASAAAARVSIPSVPSLNLASVNTAAKPLSSVGDATAGSTGLLLSDAAARDQAAFIKQVRVIFFAKPKQTKNIELGPTRLSRRAHPNASALPLPVFQC